MQMIYQLNVTLDNDAATIAHAQQCAQHIAPGSVIFLSGDLGAGKTTWVRALLKQLGYQGRVKSPTYTLVEPYHIADKRIYHFDLYRVNQAREWFDAGFDEYINPHSICLIEWPEKIADVMTHSDATLTFEYANEGQSRHLNINVYSAKGSATFPNQ
jgi:tRNA threonylcarbamoyladenosine biosynthesis protein TsaE